MRSGSDEVTGDTRPSDRPAPPTVVIRYQSHPGVHEELREIHAGLEEEGVHFRTEERAVWTEERPGRGGERDRRGEDGAVELAYAAACASTLAVGVGLDTSGTVCLHHAKLAPSSPLLVLHNHVTRTTLRWIGHNAARVVKGMPFKRATHESE
jgi:Dehydratase medium subunit